MELEDQFRYLVGGYYGVNLMDEYPLKEYILKDSIKNEFNLKIFQTKNSIIFHARLIGDLSETLYIEETDFEEFHNLNRFKAIFYNRRIIYSFI